METKLNGFTLAEMLVTLALTSIMLTFAFLGYGNIQRLLRQFSDQGTFITELNVLNERLDLFTKQPGTITQSSEGMFSMEGDSLNYSLELHEKTILFRCAERTDTFHLAPLHAEVKYEPLNTSAASLVNRISFDIYYRQQKFHLVFSKTYDAYTKLMLEKEND
ncbi:MAG: PulJ/GspJ family protein [Bacteroidia bacterium]